MLSSTQIQRLIDLARKVDCKIMEIYNSDYQVELKGDQSPLTEPDRVSHQIIARGLNELFSENPLLSEEGKHILCELSKQWQSVWLVDPLDGTKEFIKKNGMFTVNIALIEGEYPTVGVKHFSVIGFTYVGTPDGAYLIGTVDEESAHFYPKIVPTEWDGHALDKVAGGQMFDLQGSRFNYYKENLLHDHFLALVNADAQELI